MKNSWTMNRRCNQANIFIGGIPPELSAGDVIDYLSYFDKVVAFEMPENLTRTGWKGYAKVELETEEGVKSLLSHPLHFVKGYEIGFKRWIDKSEYLKNKDCISKRKLFVRFQPYLTNEQLFLYFSQFGSIESIENKINPHTKQQRNFGYIVFKRDEDALLAAQFGTRLQSIPKIWCELTMPKFLMRNTGKVSLPTDSLFDLNTREFADASRTSYTVNKQACNTLDQAHPTRMSITNLENKLTSTDRIKKAKFWKSDQSIPLSSSTILESKCNLLKNQLLSYENAKVLPKLNKSLGKYDNFKIVNIQLILNTKPTSKRYSIFTKEKIIMNHCSKDNICFRIICPS